MNFRLLPAQASDIAGDVDALYWFMIGVTVLVMIVIFLPLFYFIGKYRRGTNADRRPSGFSTLKLELTWTIIPLLIVMVMFGWGANIYVDMQKIPANTLDILVVGKQWMWYTQHPEGNREINELHVPLGRTVKLIMTSQDVIHSFYMPDFRVKQDVLPGRYTTMWFTATRPGVSHLFCAEYCGTKHSAMGGRIVAMDPRDYEQWLTTGNVSETVVQTGARLFRDRGCSGCHLGNSIVRAPPLEGLYGRQRPLQDGKMVRADDQYIHDSILLPQSQIAAGYEPVMPTYQGALSPEEVLQIVAYIKSLANVTPGEKTMNVTETEPQIPLLPPQPVENYLSVDHSIRSWLLTGDHKRIGLLYLFTIIIFFAIAAVAAALMRLELMTPAGDLMLSETYNKLFTTHGVLMVFFFLIPSIPAVLGNFFIPMMIGARDLAFPKLNLLSWYIFILAAAFTSYATIAGGADTGWTFYTPYSSTYSNTHIIATAVGIFIAGFSTILTGLNFIVTIHTMRAPGMTWLRLPLFVWSLYATSLIMVLATPVLAITLLLLAVERLWGIGVFNPALGGDPVLFQHLFWFYSHPAVYIMILPGFGVISEVIPCFSRKRIFGYTFIAGSSVAIAILGFTVWGHHMFVSGQSAYAGLIFSFISFLVAVPSSIKVFNWTATLYKGSITYHTPMLYALGFIGLFSIGGMTGLFLAAMGLDVHVHDTYFVVAHFHYIMVGGMVLAFMGGLHYWWPKISGRMYPERMGQVAALVTFIGFNLTFFPQFVMGYLGMPRRYHAYADEFQIYHVMSTAGASILGIGYLLPALYLVWSLRYGPKAPPNPWEATGLEWQTHSPPPKDNFEVTPVVTEEPYSYEFATTTDTIKKGGWHG